MEANLAKFTALNAQVVGVNTDTIFTHKAFQKALGGLSFPLASDRWPYAETATAYGIFPASRHDFGGVNDRAVFVVDKNGRMAWSRVYELKQLPDVTEIIAEVGKLT